MKKVNKWILLIIMMTFGITGCYIESGLTGCTIKGDFDGANDAGVKYLKKKYKTKCEYLYPDSNNDGLSGRHNFYVKCDIPNGEEIYVESYLTDTNGKFEFADNYPAHQYKNETIDLLSKSLNNLGFDYNLYYFPNKRQNKSNLESIQEVSSFKDFLSNSTVDYIVTIKTSNYPGRKIIEEKLVKHVKEIKGQVPKLKLYLLVIPDDKYDYYNSDYFKKIGFINIGEFNDAISLSFSEDFNCYTIRFNCDTCDVEDTTDTCMNVD